MCSAKTGWWGGSIPKEERVIGFGDIAFSASLSNRFSSSHPVLGPTTTSPYRRTCDTDSVAFLGFYSANQITFLTFPTLGQGSDSSNLLCPLQLMDLLSSLQSFMAVVVLLLISFSLKIYSLLKKPFTLILMSRDFWREWWLNMCAWPVLNNSNFTNCDF